LIQVELPGFRLFRAHEVRAARPAYNFAELIGFSFDHGDIP
jgi:hypothetical protein